MSVLQYFMYTNLGRALTVIGTVVCALILWFCLAQGNNTLLYAIAIVCSGLGLLFFGIMLIVMLVFLVLLRDFKM